MSEQYLYLVQYVTDRELTTTEIVDIRAQHGNTVVTNVIEHPFPSETIIQGFLRPRGYVAAVVVAERDADAAIKLGDVIRTVLGEAHLTDVHARQLCAFNPNAPVT